jgi:selenocysteine-specific translation elongation factor
MNSKIINISTTTETGFDGLINIISRINIENKQNPYSDVFFKFIEVFTIPDIGTIYHGVLVGGTINVGDTVEILCHNIINKFKIKSIHRKTLNVDSLFAGETGSITFYNNAYISLDKTAIIIGDKWKPKIKNTGIFKLLSFTFNLKEKQYLLYVCNNIVPVVVKIVHDNYTFECIDNLSYLTDNNIAILRDNDEYFFIQLLTLNKS